MVALPEPAWLIALKLLAVTALVLLNGFFVAAEFAIVKVRSTQLAAEERRGNRRAPLARHVTGHLDAYLSATQLGITLASLGLGWLGEPAVATLVEPVLHAVGVTNPTVLRTVGFAIAFGIITFLHIVIGELAPKSLAIQRSQGVTLRTSRPLHAFYILFRPLIVVLNGTANWLLRRVGMQPASESELAHSEEELRLLLAEQATGATGTLGREILLNALDLRRRQVREIMMARPRIVVLSTTSSLEANLRVAWESGYTRFPLAERGDPDRVVGMIHLKDLVRIAQASGPKDVLSIRRDMPIVPESLSAEQLLSLLLAKEVHLAVVVDEHGTTVGLVTLEDVLEELVGEIRDEFDEETAPIRRVSDTEFVAEGTAPLYEVANLLNVALESDEVSTIGGFVVQHAGRIPATGDHIALPGVTAIVRSADRKRVKSLTLVRHAEGAEES